MDKSAKAKVYFTSKITKENLIKVYDILGRKLQGKVAVKIHSEGHDKGYILQPEFMKPLVDHVNGTLVECKTAYPGQRDTSEKHWKVIEKHGLNKITKFDLMDEDGEIELPVPEGLQIKKNYVGKNLANYDSLLVLRAG